MLLTNLNQQSKSGIDFFLSFTLQTEMSNPEHDPELDQKLASVYNNLRKGLRSTHKLWLEVREKVPAPKTVLGYKYEPSLRYVQNWINQQAAHSTHQHVLVKHYFPIRQNRYAPWQRMQMDVFYPGNPRDPAQQTGNTCVLLIIDTVTRYLLAYPMKSKDGSDIVKAFKQFLKDTDELNQFPPYEIDTDQESAVIGTLKTYCEENGVDIQFVINTLGQRKDTLKLAFIDRASRTLRTLIDKYQVQYDTSDWDRALPDLVYGYNHTAHEGTNVSPADMLKESNGEGEAWQKGIAEDQDRMNKLETKAEAEPWNQQNLHVGSLVRVPVDPKTFLKKSKQRWKTAPGKIIKVKDGIYYTVKSENGVENRYKKYELLPIRASMHTSIVLPDRSGRYLEPQGGARRARQEEAKERKRQRNNVHNQLH